MLSGWPKEYFMVIFTSQRTESEPSHYALMAERMIELAQQQQGFLGMESVREDAGLGITISYWRDRESIETWRRNTEHQHAQRLGRQEFYSWFQTRIGKVTEERSFGLDNI
jgi:heme-degrading monooxygenase HmoA